MSNVQIDGGGLLVDVREQLKSNDLLFGWFSENGNPAEVEEAWRLQRDVYISKQIAPASAWAPNGLSENVDRARGDNVSYLLAADTEQRIVASVRLISGEHTKLPSYDRCRLIGTEGGAFLDQTSGINEIVEIAALCKRDDVSSEVIFAMYKQLFQMAILYGQSWFMGVVPSTKNELLATFGPNVVKILGRPVRLGMEGIDPSLSLTPIYIDPRNAFDVMYRESLTASPDRATFIHFLINYYSGGLPDEIAERIVPDEILRRSGRARNSSRVA